MADNRNPRGPSLVDLHVGRRLQMRRRAVNLSQQKLAKRLGVTFQQVQKYEQGRNRLGAGRLYDAARALDIPVSWFFEGFRSDQPHTVVSDDPIDDFLKLEDGVKLAAAFARIRDPEVRRRVIELADTLGEATNE